MQKTLHSVKVSSSIRCLLCDSFLQISGMNSAPPQGWESPQIALAEDYPSPIVF